ncbi:MAG TPA: response regulator [Chloroflexota bacterium]|nr:response regulator [Chloroflexota bacterium]
MQESAPVMIVEDEPDLAQLLSDVLRSSGYRVLLSTPGSAVERLESAQPALLLLDYAMPGRTGAEVLADMRARVATIPPVILITGRDEVQRLAQDVGASAFLRKPFEMDELLEQVERLIGSQSS